MARRPDSLFALAGCLPYLADCFKLGFCKWKHEGLSLLLPCGRKGMHAVSTETGACDDYSLTQHVHCAHA